MPTDTQGRGPPVRRVALDAGPVPAGHLADQVLHFARLLRRAGLPIGSDRVLWAVRALQEGGLERRSTFHAALTACLLGRPEHQELFDQAFDVVWQNPWEARHAPAGGAMKDGASAWPEPEPDDPAASMAGADVDPAVAIDAAQRQPPPLSRRLLEALTRSHDDPPGVPASQAKAPSGSAASPGERLRRTDFAAMSSGEFRDAMQALSAMPLAFPVQPTRRRALADSRGRVDGRATLRAAARHPVDLWRLRHTRPRPVWPSVVMLADISGSMAPYARLALHLAHALGQGPVRAESFVFGTRLTRLTPWLRQRDADVAIARACTAVEDWSGGTRIAPSLHAFNQHWARRIPGSRTTVLLLTDGLERGDTTALGFEMERLRKSCRRLIWLNPLLRYAGFEARAAGIRAIRPHVDDFLPVHHLDSLVGLFQALRHGPRR